MKIYLASPFFNDAENVYVSIAESFLRNRGFKVYSPREHEVRDTYEVGTPKWAEETFKEDVKAIKDCDRVVMLYYGNYSDSGTAWECGFAFGIGKPVVAVHLEKLSNLMVHCSADANISLVELTTYDFENMPEKIYTGAMT